MNFEDLKIGETYCLTFLGKKHIMRVINKNHARRSVIVKHGGCIMELSTIWKDFKFEPIYNSPIHNQLDVELII